MYGRIDVIEFAVQPLMAQGQGGLRFAAAGCCWENTARAVWFTMGWFGWDATAGGALEAWNVDSRWGPAVLSPYKWCLGL